MTSKNMEARRAAFEVIACEHYLLCELDHAWSERDLEYVDTEMQVAFEVYNAALDSICVELPQPMPSDDSYASYEGGWNDMRSEVQDALTAAGVHYK